MREADRFFLSLIVKLADHLARRLGGMTWHAFMTDVDEVDLTAYRILHIGEAAKRLSDVIKSQNQEVDWAAITATRNYLSHDYAGVDEALLWNAATHSVPDLARRCAAILESLPE